MKMKVKDLRTISASTTFLPTCAGRRRSWCPWCSPTAVISQEGRTQVPPLGPTSRAAEPSSPGPTPAPCHLPHPASIRTPGQAQGRQQANGHVSQDQEEPVYLERTARAHAEGETQSVDSEGQLCPRPEEPLSDLTDLEDIEGLTVRQLKEILARNFVNYKGCCEKWELMEGVTAVQGLRRDSST